MPIGATPAARTFPGPQGSLLSGSIFEAWEDPLALFTKGVQDFGDLVRFRFGWLEYYLINDAVAAHRVLVENAKAYRKSPNYRGLKVMLGEGLLTSEGDFWRRQRKLAQPAFHREKLAGFARTMAGCTEELLERWKTDVAPKGVPVDIHAEMNRLTFRVVGKTLLGADLEHDAGEFGASLNIALVWANQYVESVVRVPPWVPTPKNVRFRKAQRTIEGVVGRVVAERRANPRDEGDLLGMFMSVRDADTGETMNDRQLMDELLTMTLAGHETTANALAFTFYLLSKHPDVARKLRAEAAAVLAGRTPQLEDLSRMPFTRAVVEEALRLYPPAWVMERQATEDDEVLGHRVPKGAIVGISPYVIHRNPRYWSNPEGFDPDRFAAPDARRPKLAYLPFGGGPRTCIGNAFAMMELQIIVPMIMQKFSLDLVPGFRLDLDPSVTLRPKRGVPMTMTMASGPS
jgi:cytochrome P450